MTETPDREAPGDDLARLRDLLAGAKENVAWKHGDTTAVYCGKAGKFVTQNISVLNHNGPPTNLGVFCQTGGCMGHFKYPALPPPEKRISRPQLEHEAVKALPRLLDRLARTEAEHQAEVAEARRGALRDAADELPHGQPGAFRCSHRCYSVAEHIAPSGCLTADQWLRDRADRIATQPTETE